MCKIENNKIATAELSLCFDYYKISDSLKFWGYVWESSGIRAV